MADGYPRVARPAGLAPDDPDPRLVRDPERTPQPARQARSANTGGPADPAGDSGRRVDRALEAEVLDAPPRHAAFQLTRKGAPADAAIWKKLRKRKVAQGLAAPIRLPENQDRTLALAIRFLPGGRKRFLTMVKMAVQHKDPYALAWWACYESLAPVEQTRVNLDTICMGADVPADVILGTTVSHAVRYGREAAYLIAAVSQPRVMRTHVRQAASKDGIDDRRMFLNAMGYLPQKKGTQININNQATAQAAAKADSQATHGVPSFLQDVEDARGDEEPIDAVALGPHDDESDTD